MLILVSYGIANCNLLDGLQGIPHGYFAFWDRSSHLNDLWARPSVKCPRSGAWRATARASCASRPTASSRGRSSSSSRSRPSPSSWRPRPSSSRRPGCACVRPFGAQGAQLVASMWPRMRPGCAQGAQDASSMRPGCARDTSSMRAGCA